MSSITCVGAQARVLEAGEAVPEGVAVAQRPQHGAAQVLEHREVVEDVGDLEAARQALAVDLEGLEADDVLALEFDAAFGGRQARADQVEQRGFAGAVGADDGVALAAMDVEVDAADDFAGAEILAQALESDGGSPGTFIACPRAAWPSWRSRPRRGGRLSSASAPGRWR
jgi:hypothetical protein